MQVYDRPASETLRLLDEPDGAVAAPWALFDPKWYRLQYRDAPESPDAVLLEWHLTRGQTLGHSPNRYFDEAWQRRTWPGILELIDAGFAASAFDAWCRGAHITRPPHWLFDPNEYQNRYPTMTNDVLAETGFINHYHHYLGFGAAECRVGHALFDPAFYLEGLDPAEAEAATSLPFSHYLLGLENGAPERRTSLLFDPAWYGDRYGEAVRLIKAGRYRSLLEHYLCNDRPTEFEPSSWFSETHYLNAHPSLAKSIGSEGFRNRFAHFLAYGLAEGRSPHPALDLAWYAKHDIVRADIEAGRADNAFAHWIAIGYPSGLAGRASAPAHVSRDHAIALFERRANTIWPLLGRHKLDFTCRGTPCVSVIMPVRDHFAATMHALASLRAQSRSDIELILIDCNPPDAGTDIEVHVTGATLLRFAAILTDAAARDAGLVCATAEAVLFLADSVDLAPGAVGNALARLASDPMVGAVGGRLVEPNGELLEAGGIVWRDGDLHRYMRGAPPSAPEANFVRDTDFCSTLFLLMRRGVLASLPEREAGIADTTHDAADLCTRVRRAGFRVIYEPDALAFLMREPLDARPGGKAAFVAAHAEYLAGQPEFDPRGIVRARSRDDGRTRILFVEDAIPLRRTGSGFVRSNDVLRAMAASGASVTVFPMNENRFPLSAIRAELPDTVEVMHDLTAADFAGFIAARRGCHDLVWIARTHNLARIDHALSCLTGTGAALPAQLVDAAIGPAVETFVMAEKGHRSVLERLRRAMTPPGSPDVRIIVDTEAVMSVRRAAFESLRNETFDLDAALSEEFADLDAGADVVAVNAAEAAIIGARHSGNVTVLGHALTACPTPRRFERRTGMLFVGALHAMDHPNYDGLAWFIDEVLPLIERALSWETRLTVAGYVAPGVALDRFKAHSRVTLRGPVADLTPLYDANRVFVAPARFAAGIPYKVHEAAAFGVPVVTTSLLADQLGWPDAEVIGATDVADPAGFAARVIALHRDANLWSRMREAALARVAVELDPGVFGSCVRALLSSHRTDQN